jgi:hypothetical protein
MRFRMVKLFGKEPRMQTFSLLHDEYCVHIGECQCEDIKVKMIKTSKRFKKTSVVTESYKSPKVITVPYHKSVPVDETVLKSEVIQTAIRQRKIMVVK